MSTLNPAPATVLDELASIPERLSAAAHRVRDAVAQLNLARKQRDGLIVEAVDQAGLSQRAAAQHAEISQAHLVRVLSNAGGDE